jgi:hypothetical protein
VNTLQLPPPSMCIGFTGTRGGMTDAQHRRVRRALFDMLVDEHGRLEDPRFAVHGDCVGADAHFDAICVEIGLRRGIFPSDIPSMRAYCDQRGAVVLHEPAPPLVRNRWIALSCERIIATPGQMEERKRSGTSHCIRASRSTKRKILTIWPDGSERFEGGAW